MRGERKIHVLNRDKKSMKITLGEIFLTATAIVTVIGVHANTSAQQPGMPIQFASSTHSTALVSNHLSANTNTSTDLFCESVSLGLHKGIKSPES